jgi:hypothetical protein
MSSAKEKAIEYFWDRLGKPFTAEFDGLPERESLDELLYYYQGELADSASLGDEATYMLRAEVELLRQCIARARGDYSQPIQDPLFNEDGSSVNLDELRKRQPRLYTLEEISLLYPLGLPQLRKLRLFNESNFNSCCSTIGSKVLVHADKLDQWIEQQGEG